MHSILSEKLLMNEERPCILCGDIAQHNYHMIVDHIHGSPFVQSTKLNTIELNAPCNFCEDIGRPSCCRCFEYDKNDCFENISGIFVSLCKICAEDRICSIQEGTTYRYCLLCVAHSECPKCAHQNTKHFKEMLFGNYQDPTNVVDCTECGDKYTPRDNDIFGCEDTHTDDH